jgi:hypothetical protein
VLAWCISGTLLKNASDNNALFAFRNEKVKFPNSKKIQQAVSPLP